jgi:geranylgeranyl diphosphate synthase type I
MIMEKPEVMLQGLREAVDREMREVLQADGRRSDLFFGMIHYHMGWVDQALRPVPAAQGKLIRPILLLLSCEAAGGQWEQAVPAAAALEILHNFTLVHDDIEDSSPTRRGRPTLWTLQGVPQAINTGDAMFAAAQLALGRLSERGVPDGIVLKALRRLNETCIELTRGQFRDMQFELRDDVGVEEYVAMIQGKTAALLALATELGARIAGADEVRVRHFARFGRDLGLAFQIRDDILGIWGDETEIGKSAESDILSKKKSLPVLYGLSVSEALRAHYAKSAESADFVPTAIALLDSLNAHGFATGEEARYANGALLQLHAARPEGDAARLLSHLTDLLLNRSG